MSPSKRDLMPSDSVRFRRLESIRYTIICFLISMAGLSPGVPTAQAQSFCFDPLLRYDTTSHAAGLYPMSVVAVDLDGDGDRDLASSNSGSDDVSVLMDNGDGTFEGAVNYAISGCWSLFAADLDGDGDQDLAVTHAYPGSVSVLKNNGDGTFAVAGNYASGLWTKSVFAADLDGDGDQDLAVAGVSTTGDVSVLKNNGDGTFAVAVKYAAGSWSNSVFAADLDGDGDADLAVANNTANNVTVLVNDGDGTFAAAGEYDTGMEPRWVTAADLDGDGDADLAVANRYDDNVAVLKNNGDGTFVTAVNYTAGEHPMSIFAADLDGDSDADLAVALEYGDVSVLKNTGDGTFATAISIPAGNRLASVFAADLDGDGDRELAVGHGMGDRVTILKNPGDGTFAVPTSPGYAAGTDPSAVAAADLNEDGSIDLVVTNSGSGDLSYLTNNGDGTFSPPVNHPVGPDPNSVAVADLDGDGDLDLGVAYSGNIAIIKNNGGGTFGTATTHVIAGTPRSLIAADLDADGDPDLVFVYETTPVSGNVAVLTNDGDGNFGAPLDYAADGFPRSVCAADLDADGDLDLAVARGSENAPGNMSIYKNDGFGAFAATLSYAPGEAPGNSVVAADLDKDGDLDLAVGLVTSGGGPTTIVLLNNGDGSFEEPVPFGFSLGAGLGSVCVADIDGDGNLDLVIGNSNAHDLVVHLNPLEWTYGWYTLATPFAINGSVIAADFNRDGGLDIAFAHPGTTVAVSLNRCVDSLNVVSTTADSLPGSLRSALAFANTNPGPDTITFTIAGTIQATSWLPALSDPLGGTVILGFTAPGAISPTTPTVTVRGAHLHFYFPFTFPPGLLVESSHNRIEGLIFSACSVAGVAIVAGRAHSNTVSGCNFIRNGVPGIDLGEFSTTLNDPGDTDSGPNTLLNYPVFDSVFQVAGDTFTVFGTSAPHSRVELFLAAERGNPQLQWEGFDHGPAYSLLSWTVADIDGKFSLDSIIEPEWSLVTATATDTLGNTSELSLNKYLTPDPLRITAYSEPVPSSSQSLWLAQSPSLQLTVVGPPNFAGHTDSIGPLFNTFGSRGTYDSLTDWDGGGRPDARVVIASPDTGTYKIVYSLIGDPGSYLTGIGVDGHSELHHTLTFASGKLLSVGLADTSMFRLAPPERGSLHEDGRIDVRDVVKLILIVFAGAPMPEPPELADLNCDGVSDISDVMYLIDYTFNNGPAPCK